MPRRDDDLSWELSEVDRRFDRDLEREPHRRRALPYRNASEQRELAHENLAQRFGRAFVTEDK